MTFEQLAKNAVEESRKYLCSSDCRIGSPEICYLDALNCLRAGDYKYAAERAMKSLAYSVGMNHPAYKEAEFQLASI